MSDDAQQWRLNYFNYFTEVEEQFQKARGSGLFLLSPLDWALVESWKNGGVPLEAVLRGIDAAFDKWRQRKNRTNLVNSLAYCAQAVMREAEAMAKNLPSQGTAEAAEDAFPIETVRTHLEKARATLAALAGYEEIALAVERILGALEEHLQDPQELDQRLTAIEEKMAALARTRLADDDLFEMRRELEFQLRPYRSKMSGDQLARLEKSFLDRKVYERAGLPRLSLFFMV
ncbi:MAG: hypothetical protein ABSC08_18245 [Bryobacteraceae bacterium]|jgi:hypothetical protein